MSNSFDSNKKGQSNSGDPNVIQLGFNISVSGKSASGFEVFVNDKKQACGQLSDSSKKQITSHTEDRDKSAATADVGGRSCNKYSSPKDVNVNMSNASEASGMAKTEDSTIIDEIKSAMGNFEKFSEHLKEIPRLSTRRVCTSTPCPEKSNSRSEGNLSLCGKSTRSYVPKYDFRDGKYLRRTKQLRSDLFLKPLPAEDYFKRAYIRRFYDAESYHHYTSVDSIPQYYEFEGEYKTGRGLSKSDNEKSDGMSSASDVDRLPDSKLSKKDGNETNADKQSTSSESTKDIKIYQSGGIIIMQNFNENTDLIEKKDLVDNSKLIENCNKIKEKLESTIQSSDESQKLLLNSSSDEFRGHSGKIVQFDLSSCENSKSKSMHSSFESTKNEQINTKSDHSKINEIGLFSQNQDFASLSTQENDSITSNLLGMSPTSSTSGKKLEWDSGADVGYLSRDLTRETMSTIERIILKGLSDESMGKNQIVYQKTEEVYPAKFVPERMVHESTDGMSRKNNSSTKKSGSEQGSVASKLTTSQTSSQSDECRAKREMEKVDKQRAERRSTPKGKNKTKVQTRDSKSKESHKNVKHKSSGKANQSNEKTRSSDIINVEEKFVQTGTVEKEKPITTVSDKSVYVNTLFTDLCFELPLQDISRSDESGRSESSTKSKENLSARVKKLKKRKSSHPTNLTAGLKDKINNIIEIARHSGRSEGSKPASRDDTVKSSKHEDQKEAAESSLGQSKDVVIRSRPISASSSSVRTVMQKPDVKRNVSDQNVQTTELVCESIGVQAFQSAGSSPTRVEETVNVEVKETEKTCSKSIQAPGMNASLPKHLAHPKQQSFEVANTKSTQFFGGPITSLPNFHAKEPIVERVKILKTKTNSDAENNRIKMENVKNKSGETQNDDERLVAGKGKKDPENKENVSEEEFTDNSKRQSNHSRRETRSNNSAGFGSCEVQLSDDGKNLFLTSQLLKEHDNSIDRNIIQEKYFESQLREIERREMVSKSTSMEKKHERERDTQTGYSLKTGVSVSCQYSSSLLSKSDEVYYAEPDTSMRTREDVSEATSTWKRHDTNEMDSRESSYGKAVADKSSSSTSNREKSTNKKYSVDRALSFEYLPGHIYESTTNLKDKSHSGTERNNSDSQQSTNTTATTTQSENKEIDSPHTLVLEDTDISPIDSDRMKSLDNNISELETVVSKLHEKEAIFQKITDSMIATVTKVNACGDTRRCSGGRVSEANSQDAEELCCEIEITNEGEKLTLEPAKDVTTACQTDDITPDDPVMFYEEKKKLEERMSSEKEQQIKWIENEIKHLNMLRSLLEKQEGSKASTRRKKRHHYLTETSDGSPSNGDAKENILKDILTESVKKVSEDTIKSKETLKSSSLDSRTIKELAETRYAQFGMAWALRNGRNAEVTTMPIGLQLTLKNRKSSTNSRNSTAENQEESVTIDTSKSESRQTSPNGGRTFSIGIQYPSSTNRYQDDNHVSFSVNPICKGRCECVRCSKAKCLCKNSPTSRGSNGQGSDATDSFPKSDDINVPEIQIPSSSRLPSPVPASPRRSVEPQQQDETRISSECSIPFDKCICMCHAQPLPRCGICNLLNGCKKCSCYRRIKCCICSNSLLRKCIASASCLCKADMCQQCHCSALLNQVCSICPCHDSCKKILQDSSSQTEPRQCKCCLKKTQNEANPREIRHMSEVQHVIDNPVPEAEVSVPSELKHETEVRQPLDEKFSSEIKASLEQKKSTEVKNAYDVKNELEKRYPSNRQMAVKECYGKPSCRCKSRKRQTTEEPRHYFLQIEETSEEESSSESCPSRTDLDVITIKVPIRKLSKGFRNTDSRRPVSNSENSRKSKYFEQKTRNDGECHCCNDCVGKKSYQRMPPTTESKPQQDEEVQYSPDDDACYCDCPDTEEKAAGDEYEQNKDRVIEGVVENRGDPYEDNNVGCTCWIDRQQPKVQENKPDNKNDSSSAMKRDAEKGDTPRTEEEQPRHKDVKKSVKMKSGGTSRKSSKIVKSPGKRKVTSKCKNAADLYNFNKKEYMTKSELEREEQHKKPTRLTLQECLTVKRPDLYTRAECRRMIISEKTKDRMERHNKKLECISRLLPQCDVPPNRDLKLFTSSEMRKQTRKFYNNLPEVLNKKEEQKKVLQFKTNKIMAEIFAKNLQLRTLKGCLNLSNSFRVM